MNISGFIKRHPVFSYYFLVFTISWGGILLLIGGPGNIPGTYEQASKLFFPVLVAMFAGPFFSGIVMNYLCDGKTGLRTLVKRLFTWRMKAYWYVLAVLAGPLLVAAVLFALTLINHDFLPGIVTVKDKVGSLIFGISWGLIGGGLLEETGWTGFAIPQLRKRHSIFSTGLIVGYLWGIWHFMIAFWASDYMRSTGSWVLFVAGFLAFYLVALPAYRILLVLVYDKTTSLPVIMLMHAFLSASTIIFAPSAIGMVSLVWNLTLGIVLWIIIGVIAATRRPLLIGETPQ
ncbi:MAG: CAAX amino terminal protease family [uncultured bacterium]|nr:MAG: CAAX amino terminal protease family [uncultured bacterium]